ASAVAPGNGTAMLPEAGGTTVGWNVVLSGSTAPGVPGTGVETALALSLVAKPMTASTPLFRIFTRPLSTSMVTTSTVPSRSPSLSVGFLGNLPGPASRISSMARFELGPNMLVMPVSLTLEGGGGGGSDAAGSGGGGGGFKANAFLSMMD